MRGIIITLSLLAAWQLWVMITHLPPYILPSPFLVGKTLIAQFPLFMSHSLPTLIETLSGLAGATLLGCTVALGMAQIYTLKHWLKPLLLISQALPTFAIAPLLVIWLGYGMGSKVATTVFMLF